MADGERLIGAGAHEQHGAIGHRGHRGGSIATKLGFANLQGHTQFSMSAPVTPAFLGLRFAGQGFGLDPVAPAGVIASQGLIVVVGC